MRFINKGSGKSISLSLSFHTETIIMSPFEALYGKICNTPISWSDPISRVFIGPNMFTNME